MCTKSDTKLTTTIIVALKLSIMKPTLAVMPRLTQLWRKLVSKTDAVVEEATAAVVVSTLTPEQQARLDRARLRPWDDAQVLAQLNRIVDLRMALHAELRS